MCESGLYGGLATATHAVVVAHAIGPYGVNWPGGRGNQALPWLVVATTVLKSPTAMHW